MLISIELLSILISIACNCELILVQSGNYTCWIESCIFLQLHGDNCKKWKVNGWRWVWKKKTVVPAEVAAIHGVGWACPPTTWNCWAYIQTVGLSSITHSILVLLFSCTASHDACLLLFIHSITSSQNLYHFNGPVNLKLNCHYLSVFCIIFFVSFVFLC